jgi:hypothetical protein
VTDGRGKRIKGALPKLYAEYAAYCLLYGDTASAESIIKSWINKTNNHSILYEIIRTTDRHDNKVKGNLLQLAALANDFNPREKGKNKDELPDRSLHFVSGIPESLSKLGFSVFAIDQNRR